jgi:hypothetical protein
MSVAADNGQRNLAPHVKDRENNPVRICFRNFFNVLFLSLNMPVFELWTSDGKACRQASIWCRRRSAGFQIRCCLFVTFSNRLFFRKVPVFEVVATDSGQRGLASGQPYGHEVREQDAGEAIRLERPQIVIACWQVRAK